LGLAYRKKLDRLISDMNASVDYWLKAAYRENPPTMAFDDILPANALKKAIALLKKRWLRNFDRAAPKLAKYFATAVQNRSDKALAKILRDGGFSVKFQMSQAMKDVVQATTTENVGLIKSIASQHLNEVEGLVMRSVSRGRDLGYLSKELEKRYGVTKRRAALISKDQNNKATANMHRVRQVELGITQAKWRHSGGGKVPRPTHVANNGKLYDVEKGWWDPAVKQFIHPGELINCRCVSISVIPGFS
jgi:SPP1 gp7 family putative phage head morphogenesis protein